MATIDKDITLGELLDRYPESESILMGFGMHCFSCPVSRMESLEEAAEVHDVDLKLLLKKLNDMDCEEHCTCGCDCEDDDCFCEDDDCFCEDDDCCCEDDCDCED